MTVIVVACLLVAAGCGAWVVTEATRRARATEDTLQRMVRALATAEDGLQLIADTGDAHAQALAMTTLRRVRDPGGKDQLP